MCVLYYFLCVYACVVLRVGFSVLALVVDVVCLVYSMSVFDVCLLFNDVCCVCIWFSLFVVSDNCSCPACAFLCVILFCCLFCDSCFVFVRFACVF